MKSKVVVDVVGIMKERPALIVLKPGLACVDEALDNIFCQLLGNLPALVPNHPQRHIGAERQG